jgi:hypothetical protein
MNTNVFASLYLDNTANLDLSTMVKVPIGHDQAQKEYDLPAELASRSEFFRNTLKDHGLNDCWKESAERLVTLVEDDPEIFSLCLHLLTDEPLSLKKLTRETSWENKEDEDLQSDQFKDQVQVDQTTLCRLYVFAEFSLGCSSQEQNLA